MESQRKCVCCGGKLKYQKKYCSLECHAKSMTTPEVICPICGIKFHKIKKNTKFCSLGCFNQDKINQSRFEFKEPEPIEGARFIPLTQGKFAIVDEDIYADLSRFNWCAVKVSGHVYAKRTDTKEYMHVLIVGIKGLETDHVSGDTLDNRKSNLRAVTKSQNQMNKISTGRTSKYKGVSITQSRTWCARIKSGSVIYNLGTFTSEEEAARMYDNAARFHHREFARLNFPREGELSALSTSKCEIDCDKNGEVK